MYIQNGALIVFTLAFLYLIYKVGKNSEDIHGLQYDLNDLEVQVGVLEGEDWAVNSERNIEIQKIKSQNYYDGKTNDGEYDGMLGIDRRKEDGKNPKLGTQVD